MALRIPKAKRAQASRRAGGGFGPDRKGKHVIWNGSFELGQHWVQCDRCGFDHYEKDTRQEWNGSVVCLSCWEPRHPQDFVRGVHDDTKPRGLIRPDNTVVDRTPAQGSTDVPEGTFNNDPDALESKDPNDLGAGLWWDFSDQTTTFQDAARTIPATSQGDDIEGITDKTGNGKHGSRAAGTIELDLGGLGNPSGRPVGDFSALGVMRNVTDITLGSTSFTIFGVTHVPPTNLLIAWSNDISGGDDYSYGIDTVAGLPNPFQARDGGGGNTLVQSSDEQGSTQSQWIVIMVEYRKNEGNSAIYWNNECRAKGFLDAGTARGLNLGGSETSSLPWREPWGEVAIIPGTLSSGDRASGFAYFQNKWDISGKSPSEFPSVTC